MKIHKEPLPFRAGTAKLDRRLRLTSVNCSSVCRTIVFSRNRPLNETSSSPKIAPTQGFALAIALTAAEVMLGVQRGISD